MIKAIEIVMKTTEYFQTERSYQKALIVLKKLTNRTKLTSDCA